MEVSDFHGETDACSVLYQPHGRPNVSHLEGHVSAEILAQRAQITSIQSRYCAAMDFTDPGACTNFSHFPLSIAAVTRKTMREGLYPRRSTRYSPVQNRRRE